MKYFKPFVDALIEGVGENLPKTLDLILEGGAMNGAYEAGVLCYLRELEKQGKTKINRISGVSCGALIATMFLTSQLDSLDEFYKELSSSLLATGRFKNLEELIKKLVLNITDEQMSNLQNRLFITYIELNSQKRCTKSTFESKNELIECLRKTSFLPYLIDGNATTKDKCIDGGTPFVFPFDTKTRQDKFHKTIYVKLTSFRLLKEALSTRDEANVARRAVEGIQKIHDLFKLDKPNELVSFIESWTITDYGLNAIVRLIWHLSVHIFNLFILASKHLPSNITESPSFNRLINMLMEIWDDFGHRILN